MSLASRRCVIAVGGFVLFGAGLFLTGCQRRAEPRPTLFIEHEIKPHPPRAGRATFTLRVTDDTGRPVSGARISLEGNMSHAGMRPVFGEARELEPGRYESPLEFTMGGDWVILVRLTLPDGREIERQFDVKGVQSG